MSMNLKSEDSFKRINVKNEFLHRDLMKVYMTPQDSNPPGLIYGLWLALYGLKQAPELGMSVSAWLLMLLV